MPAKKLKKSWPDSIAVKARIHCDLKQGILTYRPRPFSDFEGMKRGDVLHKSWNTRFAGKQWGSLAKSGHRKGNFDGVELYSHHVVWMFATGEWPQFHVNHIDGDPANNKPSNLRLAEQGIVNKNQSMHRDNTSGVSGVHLRSDDNRWVVRIGARYIGRFTTRAEAIEARDEAERVYGYHKNHGKRPSRNPTHS